MSFDNSGVGGNEAGFVAAQEPATASEPTPIELSDESLVKLPGMEKPVKYGEHYRGLQANQTRATQEAANLRRQYEQAQYALQQREQLLRQYEGAIRQQQQGQGGQGQKQSVIDKLRSLSYLSGEEAAAVVEDLTGRFGQYDQELQRRDLALVMLHKQLQDLKKNVGVFNEQRVNQDFEGKIGRWIGDLGLPPEAKEFASELYLAYEGDDLDNEFPNILKSRWEQLAGAIRAMDRKKVEEARRLPFVPNKGGTASPSRPLNQGFKSARQIAEEMWPMVEGASET